MSSLNRSLNIKVNLTAAGNLAQGAAAAAAQAARLNQATRAGAAMAAATVQQSARASVGLSRQGALATARLTPSGQQTLAGLSLTQQGQAAAAGQRSVAATERLADRIEPLSRAAGALGAAGLASMYGGIASVSPEASSQITNSFRMIGNELGIAVIPAAVQFTGVLQSVSRQIRRVNEATGGWAGSLAFTGATALAGVGTLGMVGRVVTSTAAGLRSLGLLSEVAAPVAGQLAAQTAARATGQSAAQASPFGGQGAATAGAAGAGAGGMGLAVPAAGGAVGFGLGYHHEEQRQQMLQRGERPSAWRELGWSLIMPGAPYEIGRWWRREEAAAPPPANVASLNPQSYGSALELYQQLGMQAQQTPGPLAEQEGRAMQQWLAAINANTAAMNALAAADGGSATWGAPPASENG